MTIGYIPSESLLMNLPVEEQDIGLDTGAIRNTIMEMKRIIDVSSKNPFIREWARAILQDVQVNRKMDEASAIHNFVRDNVRYTRDPSGWEYIQTPPVLLAGIAEWMKRKAPRPIGDCVNGATKIILRNRVSQQYELKRIDELGECYQEYDALSYDMNIEEWKFKPITAHKDQGVQKTYRVKLKNGAQVYCTLGHKWYRVETHKGKVKSIERQKLGDIPFERNTRREPTAKILCAKQIPCLNMESAQSLDALWMDGIYIAEGSCAAYERGEKGRVAIAQDKSHIRQEIDTKLLSSGLDKHFQHGSSDGNLWYRDHHGMRRGSTDVFLELGGRSATKRFRQEHLSMPYHQIEQLLDGYQKGDGHRPKGAHLRMYYKTISPTLFEQLTFLHLVLGRPLWQRICNQPTVAGNQCYSALEYQCDEPTKWRKEVMDGVSAVGIKSVEYVGKQTVYDITVKDTHNFVTANGCVLSNCDDMTTLSLSLLKSVGFPVVIKTVGYQPGMYSHVYGLVFINGRWYPCDTVRPDKYIGWESGNIQNVMEVEV